MRECPDCGETVFKLKIAEKQFKIVKCKSCGFIYLLNPPDEKEIYEDYYEIQYSPEDYKPDSKYGFLSEIHLINLQRVSLLKKIGANGKLLDIGCGTGLFMNIATQNGFEIEGTDVSRKALDFAKSGFGLNVYRKTLDDLIDEKKTYDVITLWHVVEHFLEPVIELNKIFQLLKPNGYCIIEVPNFNSIKFRLSGKKWKGGNHPLYHRSFFTGKSLMNILEKSGFRSKRIKISYKIPSKGKLYNLSKRIFNIFAMDTFLDFIAYRK